MKAAHFDHRHGNMACDLDAAHRAARADEWRRLRNGAGVGTETIPGGARLRLRPDAWEAAVDLARREAGCCGFLDFTLEADDDEMRLEVTSPTQDAHAVAACLVGLDSDCVLDWW